MNASSPGRRRHSAAETRDREHNASCHTDTPALVLELMLQVRHDSGHILESGRHRCTVVRENPLKSWGLGSRAGPYRRSQILPESTWHTRSTRDDAGGPRGGLVP